MVKDALKVIESAAFGAMSRVLAARAQDATDELTSRSTLVIAPHPDDETLGCGATIARLAGRGQTVHVAVVADGRHSHPSKRLSPDQLARIRRDEVLEACRRLGVPPERTHCLGFEDRHIARDGAAIRERLAALIREVAPQQVLAPTAIDRSSDHQALGTVIASLRADGTLRCPVFEYPIWFFNARTWLSPGRGRLAPALGVLWRPAVAAFTLPAIAVRTDGHLGRKRHALDAFVSQMTNLTGEPGWAVFSPLFLKQFFRRHELFFLPSPATQRAIPSARGVPPVAPPTSPTPAPHAPSAPAHEPGHA
ncbi:MAG: PIG-L deacetylase family protein [Phycisphaerales bacterium]